MFSFFHYRTSHVLRFIFICNLFTVYPLYIYIYIYLFIYLYFITNNNELVPLNCGRYPQKCKTETFATATVCIVYEKGNKP
jgi:hypothetical protein